MNENDLRDCLAMFAMNGLIRHFDFDKFSQDPARVADWSYLMADAMLEARSGKDSVGLPPVRARKTKEK